MYSFSGFVATMSIYRCSARQALGLAGLDATTASAILWTYRADGAVEELAEAGLTEITCLAHQASCPSSRPQNRPGTGV
jgi:hypothetical protein